MGLLDSIRDRFGGGEPTPPQGKMRQPPQAPPQDTPEPGRGPAPDAADPAGPPPESPEPQPRGREGPRQDRSEPAPPPSPTGGRDAPPQEPPAGRNERGRPERGSTLDVDRPSDTPDDDLELPPADDPGRGPAAGPEEPPRQDPGRQRQEREPRGGEQGGDVPAAPRDYNLDLPEPGAEGENRLERIEQQNDQIIGLLEDIRDQMRGGRR